jgi:hypothetical protein
MCTFSFFCEILLHKYHIDGKHVRVYHSGICQQTSFFAMAISKYGHWRGGVSQDWQAPNIIYYNRRIQNNDQYRYVKAVSRRFVSYELLPFEIGYVMTLHSWKRNLHGWTARRINVFLQFYKCTYSLFVLWQ